MKISLISLFALAATALAIPTPLIHPIEITIPTSFSKWEVGSSQLIAWKTVPPKPQGPLGRSLNIPEIAPRAVGYRITIYLLKDGRIFDFGTSYYELVGVLAADIRVREGRTTIQVPENLPTGKYSLGVVGGPGTESREFCIYRRGEKC
ncbi:hypothetical protein HGRIS_011818 [Hohenbuehelia grisea]|uniref:Uncharacterized protein n=1 Tax=Hohenbuehelia grisea TaxID=104357 RepID=A0ABR3JW94_9AGAR